MPRSPTMFCWLAKALSVATLWRLKLAEKVLITPGPNVCVSLKLRFWLRVELWRVKSGKLETDWDREEFKKYIALTLSRLENWCPTRAMRRSLAVGKDSCK